jgi:alpha-glucuronidase
MHFQSRRAFLKTTVALSALFLDIPVRAAATENSSSLHSPVNEDGYRAWLRYDKLGEATCSELRRRFSSVVVDGDSATAALVSKELTEALSGMLGMPIARHTILSHGAILVGTFSSARIRELIPEHTSERLGSDGFVIHSVPRGEVELTVIASLTEIGCLYGAFAFLRLIQTGNSSFPIRLVEKPKNSLRILAHSDYRDGTVSRGYQGKSLWQWSALPFTVNPRLDDYARLNVSIGMNGVVLNAVDADPAYLEPDNIVKLAALADKFRPYGLKTYLSVNFVSPQQLGGLPTSDPFDAEVVGWWHAKAAEIYHRVPDFGGFLVKASSEGLAGPLDYGRTHADGANMLAGALAPYGGIVMWRAFVYTKGNHDRDRVKRSYNEFKPLDGKFADNVLVQVKNGPLDFQPREPFHPLFGAMPKTRLVGELQINQEYLGQGTHAVFLASMWKEVLSSNTFANGGQLSVAEVIEEAHRGKGGGFSATSNVGDDRNWCGHHLSQANWFAYGRLAWDTDLTPESISTEWIRMTWSNEPAIVNTIHEIMMQSYEAYVSYSMPLGLHHLVGGDHYAPMPEGYGDPNGMFHHAARDGIGYDRTRTTGSDAVDQYHAPLNNVFNDVNRCPEKLLLWFHHVPWNRRMQSGRTLWEELCFKYHSGARTAHRMEQQWLSLKGTVDDQRFEAVAAKFRTQVQDADHWAMKCLTYFSQFSRLPIVSN